MRIVALLLLPALAAAPLLGQAKRTNLRRLPGANDALALAAFTLRSMSPVDREYQRFILVPSADSEDAKVVSLQLNDLSRSTVIRRPAPLGGDDLLVLRLDLRHYAPTDADLHEWRSAWEELQFDPALSLLITRGTLNSVAGRIPGWDSMKGLVTRSKEVIEKVAPYVHTDGQTYEYRRVRRPVTELVALASLDLADVELIRLPSPEINPALYAEVTGLTGSQAPLVTAPYFVLRTSATIKDKGVYAQIYGGLYYTFAGVQQNTKIKGATDEDLLLEALGVGSVAGKVRAADIFERLRSDQRSAQFFSKVTGLPRRTDLFPTLATRPDRGSALISITHDPKAQDIDIDQHPVANTLTFRDKGREVIWTRANGLHGYSAIDAVKGAVVDEVPFDIAQDSTIPDPYHHRLQASISCKACHEGNGSDGWRTVENDVKRLLRGKRKLDIFGDTSRLNESVQATLERQAGLYEGDFEDAFRTSRDAFAAAVLRATGPMRDSIKTGQTDVAAVAVKRLVGLSRDYWYNLVDAKTALRELRVGYDGADALGVLNDLLRPEASAAVPVPGVDVIVPEDVRLAGLLEGIPIPRSQFDLARGFAAGRVARNWARVAKARK